jgi:hypothetical protein
MLPSVEVWSMVWRSDHPIWVFVQKIMHAVSPLIAFSYNVFTDFPEHALALPTASSSPKCFSSVSTLIPCRTSLAIMR